MAKTGVYACYENQFKIQTGTGSGSSATYSPIADCENYSVSIDGAVQEWTPYDSEGWVKRLMTGKGVTIAVTAKRNVGDTGNDKVASMAFSVGAAAQSNIQWAFPKGEVVIIPCVINVTNPGSGESTGVAPLEFEIMSNGKPTITPAA